MQFFLPHHTPMTRRKPGEIERQVGSLVRKLREEKGFTQEAFAHHSEIDRAYQGRIERGEVKFSLQIISHIAKGLDLKMWELLKIFEDNNIQFI